MRVRWTGKAADDLRRIVEYIRKDNPAAARRVAQTIYKAIAELRTFPKRGRAGLVENTRELVFAPWPYIAVYEIIGDQAGASHPSRCAGLAIRT
jgi:toxin ParE1/3/4